MMQMTKTYVEFEPFLSVRPMDPKAIDALEKATLPSDLAFVTAHHIAEEFGCDVCLTSPRNGHILYTIHATHDGYWDEAEAPRIDLNI